jgi:hypothetical protein
MCALLAGCSGGSNNANVAGGSSGGCTQFSASGQQSPNGRGSGAFIMCPPGTKGAGTNTASITDCSGKQNGWAAWAGSQGSTQNGIQAGSVHITVTNANGAQVASTTLSPSTTFGPDMAGQLPDSSGYTINAVRSGDFSGSFYASVACGQQS